MAQVMRDWDDGNVLFLAHRIELLDQMADHLAEELGYRPQIEQGTRGLDPETLFAAGGVIVGSIQSMITPRRQRKFAKHPFGLIVVDEFHHATSASYRKLFKMYQELNPRLRLLGCTATPNRSDGTALGLVCNSVAYNMGICEGIDKGWLVDIREQFAVVPDLDLSMIPCRKNEFGELDFSPGELETLLNQEGTLHAMSRPILDCTEDGKQALLFAASVRHAHLWAAVLNHYRPGCCRALDATTHPDERADVVKTYKRGDLQFLANYGLFGEGTDLPSTAIVCNARVTKSVLIKTQQLGRVTRPLPGTVDGLATAEERKDAIAASAKPFGTCLDFVDGKSKIAVTATDVLGGNYDLEECERADDIIGAREGKNANVRDALDKARAMLLLEQEEERRRPLRTIVQGVHVPYHLQDVSQNGSASTNGNTGKTSRGGATDAQVAALVNLGVANATALAYSRKQAGEVMTKLRAERCTAKQAKTLAKYGYDPKQFNCDSASATISAISANGWRRP